MDDQRLTYLLATWREYMHDPEIRLGYPSRAAGIRYSAGRDFGDMTDSLDFDMARAVDACIDSLPLMERMAVQSTVLDVDWRMVEPLYVVHERARGLLKIALKSRGIE